MSKVLIFTPTIQHIIYFHEDGTEDRTRCCFDMDLDISKSSEWFEEEHNAQSIRCRLRFLEGAPWRGDIDIIRSEVSFKLVDMRSWTEGRVMDGVTVTRVTQETVDDFSSYVVPYIKIMGWL